MGDARPLRRTIENTFIRQFHDSIRSRARTGDGERSDGLISLRSFGKDGYVMFHLLFDVFFAVATQTLLARSIEHPGIQRDLAHLEETAWCKR